MKKKKGKERVSLAGNNQSQDFSVLLSLEAGKTPIYASCISPQQGYVGERKNAANTCFGITVYVFVGGNFIRDDAPARR